MHIPYSGFYLRGPNFPITFDHTSLQMVTDSTVNKPTACNYRLTAGAYNRNIDKRLARKLIWPHKRDAIHANGSQILQ